MDSDAEISDRRNDVLSQSYKQGVGRVAQQINDVGFSFELPKEVLEKKVLEREKGWDNLFDKYADEASDEIELNIDTMEPAATEEDEDDEDEEDEEDEEEPREYYSKCRAPMRKLPALIQYWIDTGNPPYQFIGDDDHSGTGSSLSEGEHSRTGQSDILRETSDKGRPDDTSPYSSVDTAAYIFSNTNVTKKADTIAIVEGARKPEDFSQNVKTPPRKDTVDLQKSTTIGNKDISFSSTEQGLKTIFNNPYKSPQSPTKKLVTESGFRASTTPIDNAKSTVLFPLPMRSHNQSSSSQQSVKLSEVLPTVKQLDELLDESQVMKPPRVRSSLSKVRRKPKIVVASSPTDDDERNAALSQSSQNSSILHSSNGKPSNRRKLYTGRNSPVDLVMELTTESVQRTENCMHPALEPIHMEKPKITSYANRARARRKRKRASQAAELVNQGNNTSPDSVTPNGTGESKGDMRYTDFFESLGLTPSKTIIGETPVRKPVPKRSRKSEKRGRPRKPKEKVQLTESLNSSIKETGDTSQLTEDMVFSPIDKKSSSIEAAKKLLGNKILTIKIERLSENCLAPYRRRDVSPESAINLEKCPVEQHRENILGSPGNTSIKKKGKTSHNGNIELLTTITHDSDSSTILICACNNDSNEQYSDSDNSLFPKNRTRVKKKSSIENPVEKDTTGRSLRSREHKSPVKSSAEKTKNHARPKEASGNENIVNSPNKTQKDNEVMEKLTKLPKLFVSLEKLSINNLTKLTKITDNLRSNESVSTGVEKNQHFTSELSGRTKNCTRSGRSTNFVEPSSVSSESQTKNKCVTIGSRIVNDFNEIPSKSENIFASPARCSLGITISSDDEDSFVRFVKEFGSKRQTMQIENGEETKKISGDKIINNATSGDEEISMLPSRRLTRFRSNFGVSITSDEEEDDVETNPIKKGLSKRRIIKVELDAHKDNELINRKKPIIGNNITKELTNGDEEVRLNNRHDESNRRKVASVEKTHENDEPETKVTDGVRRSTRQKKLSTSGGSEEYSTNDLPLSTRLKSSRNLFANAKESNVDDEDEVFAESRDNKFVSVNSDQSDKTKSQTMFTKFTRSGHDDKRTTGGSLNFTRFQTRLDSDSDTDFDSLRFSINTNYNKSNDKEQKNATEIVKTISTEESKDNDRIAEDNNATRSSPRRPFKTWNERKIESIEKKLKRGNNLFEESPDVSEKDFVPAKNEIKRVSSSNNRLPLSNELTTSETSSSTNDSNAQKKDAKSKIDPQHRRTSRKNSLKSDRAKNPSKVSPIKEVSSPLGKQKKVDTSPIAKKRLRRTRILGTPMEYESDDDAKLIENNVNSDDPLMSKKSMLPNGISSKQLNDKYVIHEENLSKKHREASKNLFSNESHDDSVDDIDLMFGVDAKSRSKECTVVIDSLNFVPANKHKNLSNMRQSTISFRTKLRSDSDDDNLL